MSATMIVALLGAGLGAGIVMAVYALQRPQPALKETIDRLHPPRTSAKVVVTAEATGLDGISAKAGSWLEASSLAQWVSIPRKDLALAGIPVNKFLGEKIVSALLGLFMPWVLTTILAVAGVSIPLVFTLLISFVAFVALFFWPDIHLKNAAKDGRDEYARALSAYIDLVALERMAGAGSTQALEQAAEVGDGPVFKRLREELAKARWHQRQPWDNLADLAEEMNLPELGELADIMRMSGDGASVYNALRARSAGIRDAILSKDKTKANSASERMSMPTAMLCVVFTMLLVAPPVLTLAS